jgi:aryl sulfotransferase
MNAPKPGAKPPWINSERVQGLALRDGDIWISAAPKSGTNWMMNIVHQLLTGGDTSFESIYHVVPWPEFVEHPGQPAQVVHERIAKLPAGKRRAFKSHAAPPELPFVKAGTGTDLKYIVVCRNPEEALVSFKVFLDQHTDAFYDLWQVPRAALTRPSFEAFYRDVVDAKGMQGMFYGFLAGWWQLRREPNVLMLHFADMKKDMQGAVRKVASFLGTQLTAAQWANVDNYASFEWMKQNESKFEKIGYAPVPVLESGAMVRKGKTGSAHEEGMTAEIASHLRRFGSQILTDAQAMNWLYAGGPLP